MPCSAQTAAAKARVQVERALPNWRGLWGKSAFSRSLRSASKSLAAVCGRRDCGATTASPRVSKARRTLRTACGLHPTAWAMSRLVSPRAGAKRVGQREWRGAHRQPTGFEGAQDVAHRLRTAPDGLGDVAAGVPAGGGQEDVAAAHREPV